MPASAQPLDGFRVVDAALFVSGPWAAMMLADLGADVVKVEPPGGDAYRRYGRVEDGMGVSFANVNRNKTSVVIDLKADGGRDEMLALVRGADALITNWRPGVAEQLGLCAADLHSANPGLVWCRVSGFGPDGPLAGTPAFDTVIQARSGTMFVQGDADRPEPVRGYVADKVAAMFAAQSVLAALVARGRHGTGSVVDVPMLDALAYFNGPDMMLERTRLDDEDRDAVSPQLRAVRCIPASDGWLLVSPVRGKQLKGLVAAAGHPEWIDRFRAEGDAAARTSQIYDLTATVTPSDSTEVWLRRFAEHDVPAAPVLDIDAHLADPQVDHNSTYVVYEHPRLGKIRQPRHPARWDGGTMAPDPSPAPDLPPG
ncbi:MAG: CaiB/BaiF CoA transferase family protein [Acidimicrobiales bacterium]